MIELYLHIKIYLDYIPERLKYAELVKSIVFNFEFQCQKLLRSYHNTYILFLLLFCIDLSTKPDGGLWFNRTHLPLFQKMSVKIYTNYILTSRGYNFKINYLKDKMRYEMWVYILLNKLVSSPLQQGISFGTESQNAIEKQYNFILRYLNLKFFCDEIIKAISLIFRHNMFGINFVLFLLLISEYV